MAFNIIGQVDESNRLAFENIFLMLHFFKA